MKDCGDPTGRADRNGVGNCGPQWVRAVKNFAHSQTWREAKLSSYGLSLKLAAITKTETFGTLETVLNLRPNDQTPEGALRASLQVLPNPLGLRPLLEIH
jgi:hypothetical protein